MIKTAIIVGAGIGGVATALALARRGWAVRLFERAPEISEVGAGLQISPNGMKVLDALGVTPHLEPFLFEPEFIEMVQGKTGQRVFRIPMKEQAKDRWGARFVQVHRADLLNALVARLTEISGDVIETNASVRSYNVLAEGAEIELTDGQTLKGDLVVGADGIHSSVRSQMLGPETPQFTGNYAWRAVVPADQLGENCPPAYGRIWALPGKHVVTTRIGGGKLVNFVGIVESDAWAEEGWSIKGSPEEALADLGGYDPAIDEVIKAANPIYRWALLSRPALPRWSDGAVVLVGDAAHPMLPSMAQGAVQAIEDGYFLAKHMDGAVDIPIACQTFFRSRIERVTRIQRQSRDNLNLFHKRSAIARGFHYGSMRVADRFFPSVFLRKTDWIYGFPIPE